MLSHYKEYENMKNKMLKTKIDNEDRWNDHIEL
jgi:hypothetical protein